MTAPDSEAVARLTARYPPADITPGQFEEFVAELLSCTKELVSGLKVTLHDKVKGADGTYDFDVTVRFEFCGMAFLIVVEAKQHKNPIKRELVQVLHQKLQSVSAQKAAMISTAPYQSGALEFARHHNIALVTLTEGRFTFETKSRERPQAMTREQAANLYGLPTFVGHAYTAGDEPRSTSITVMSPEYPEYVAEMIFGLEVTTS